MLTLVIVLLYIVVPIAMAVVFVAALVSLWRGGK